MLKDILNNSKTDEELLSFIEKKLKVKKGGLNNYLRKKIEIISNENKFSNAKLKASH
jgi:hypothetical protein